MAIVTYKEYHEAKSAFLRKHDDWKVETSSIDINGKYHKEYICSNGDIWYEVCEPSWRTATAEVEVVDGVKVTITKDVKLFRTEGWNSKNANSIIYYEKF